VTSQWLTPLDSEEKKAINKNIQFIHSYRYETRPDSVLSEYREYEALLKMMYRIYFDFTSLGANHFSMDWINYLEYLTSKTNWLNIFLKLADRMTRNMAFVPGLYEIDIHTGKAIDIPEDMEEK
jgi:hypothetical protein